MAVSRGSLAQNASGCVPALVMSFTINAVTLCAAGQEAMISVKVIALTKGVLKTMFLTKLKSAIAVLLVLGLVAFGGLLYHDSAVGQHVKAEQKAQKQASPLERGNPSRVEEKAKIANLQNENERLKEQIRLLLQRNLDLEKTIRGFESNRVWNMDVRFGHPRLVPGTKDVWYWHYEVRNNTERARNITPNFELVAGDKAYRDEILVEVEKKTRLLEDPTQSKGIKNSVLMSKESIPPSKPGAEIKAVHGAAFWRGVDPNAKTCSVFVGGLSNGFVEDGKTTRYKTLKVSFKRVGNEMQPVGAAEWVYREQTASVEAKDKGAGKVPPQ